MTQNEILMVSILFELKKHLYFPSSSSCEITEVTIAVFYATHVNKPQVRMSCEYKRSQISIPL